MLLAGQSLFLPNRERCRADHIWRIRFQRIAWAGGRERGGGGGIEGQAAGDAKEVEVVDFFLVDLGGKLQLGAEELVLGGQDIEEYGVADVVLGLGLGQCADRCGTRVIFERGTGSAFSKLTCLPSRHS